MVAMVCAEVVELVDALRSGRSEGNLVGVRVPPSAPVVVYWVRVNPSVDAPSAGGFPLQTVAESHLGAK